MASSGEGTRVVFVSVRGRDAALPRTRRKRALGVGDDVTWEAFCALVCQRLSLRGVKGIYHASSGAPMRSIEELQDIEDLEVEEVEEAAPPAGGRGAANGHGSPVSAPPSGSVRPDSARKAAGGGARPDAVAVSLGGGDGEEDKYARRASVHTRVLAQIVPSWAAPALCMGDASTPARERDRRASAADGETLGEPTTGRRNRKGSRRAALRQLKDPRVMLMLIAVFSCAGTMVLLYSRLTPLARLN